MPYVKLDACVLKSTIWAEPDHVRITWITMLLMADPGGRVDATAPGIAHDARLNLQQVREALRVLESPDPDSRSQNDDGRRIRRIDGGYEIINFLKYRDKDHTAAERKRRQRARQKAGGVTPGRHGVTRDVTEAEAEAEADTTHTGDTTGGGAGGGAERRERAPTIERPAWLTENTWRDYLAHRKALKAPLTATAWSRIAGELEKAQAAGWDPNDALGEAMAAGWRGFRAEWLENRTGGRGGSRDNGSGGTAFARLKQHVKAGHGLEQVRTDSPDLVPAVEQFGGMSRLRGMRESEFEFLRAQFLSIYRQN